MFYKDLYSKKVDLIYKKIFLEVSLVIDVLLLLALILCIGGI